MSRHLNWFFITLFVVGCSSAARPEWPGKRVERYLQAHANTPAAIAEGMQRGHVLIGMTPEQVVVTIGEPKIRNRGRSGMERWLYSAGLFHQDQSSHGATLAKISFISDRVALVEFF